MKVKRWKVYDAVDKATEVVASTDYDSLLALARRLRMSLSTLVRIYHQGGEFEKVLADSAWL